MSVLHCSINVWVAVLTNMNRYDLLTKLHSEMCFLHYKIHYEALPYFLFFFLLIFYIMKEHTLSKDLMNLACLSVSNSLSCIHGSLIWKMYNGQVIHH